MDTANSRRHLNYFVPARQIQSSVSFPNLLCDLRSANTGGNAIVADSDTGNKKPCNLRGSPIRWLHLAGNWFLGRNSPDFRDSRVSKSTLLKPTLAQIRIAEMIAKQIEVEQGLANTRMSWNLTFQGFTIAAYTLVAASGGTAPAKWILGTAIGLASALIAFMTMRGIIASQNQRKYLKDYWEANGLRRFFPEPFSVASTSVHGRLPSYAICIVLIVMWAILLGTQPWIRDTEPTKVEVVSPTRLDIRAVLTSEAPARPAPATHPTPGKGTSRDKK